MDTAKATTAAVIIDPRNVPDEEYQTACSVLASSIRIALSDPILKAEYEEWKRRRRLGDAS
jgi:hypothetical protein